MNAVVETITPAKAQEYLFTSKGNRPISKTAVQSYADTIKAGKWILNGETITFDQEGHLMQGHHRLNAIIMAGIAVPILVVRGVESEAFATYDCGLKRTLGQLLAMQGKKNYNTVGSIVASSEILKKYGKLYESNGTHNGRRTNLDGYDIYCKDSAGYDEAAEFACAMYQNASVLNKSWIGGLYYHLIKVGCYDDVTVKTFFDNLCSLTASNYSPIELLRSRIISEKMRGTKMEKSMLFALIAKSWNAYVEGKALGVLKFNPDVEKYPTLKLNVK